MTREANGQQATLPNAELPELPDEVQPSEFGSVHGRTHPLRWLTTAILLFISSVVIYSLITNPNFQWGIIGNYLLNAQILAGLRMTAILTVVSMAIGSVLGTILAVMRMSLNPAIAGIASVYVWFFRGTPVLVQLFLWYNLAALYPTLGLAVPFGGKSLFSHPTNDVITPLGAAFLGLTLNLTAYMAEIIRGGIISVDEGQIEAARSLGLTPIMTLRRIVLPQAIPAILPAAGNELIALLKYTSLVSILAVSDLLYSAQLIYTRTYEVMPMLLVASIWYLIATTVLSVIQYYIERRFSKGHRRGIRETPFQRIRRSLGHLARPDAEGLEMQRGLRRGASNNG